MPDARFNFPRIHIHHLDIFDYQIHWSIRRHRRYGYRGFRGRGSRSRSERWARWAVGACMLLVFVGLGVSSALGDYEGLALDSPWFWCEWTGYTAPFSPMSVAPEAISVVFLLAMYWEYAATGVFSAWSDAVVGALEIASIAVLCLVFFAPAAYHRWLDRTPATTGAAAR